MTNDENINNMSIEEKTELLLCVPCGHCNNFNNGETNCNGKCFDGVKAWLESQVEELSFFNSTEDNYLDGYFD